MHNILFIGTKYMGYHSAIIREIIAQGYSVDYFEDRPSSSSFFRGISKLQPNYLRTIIKAYFEKLLLEIKTKKYDVVFIVNGKSYNKDMIGDLKKSQPQAEFVFWAWDSIVNDPQIKEIAPMFDRAYTFDFKDCEENDFFKFLPFFYTKSFDKLENSSSEFDLMYVGTAFPYRYKIVKKTFENLEAKGYHVFSWLFLTRLQFLYYKYWCEEFRGVKMKDFHFKKFSEKDYFEKLKVSKAVFDVVRTGQTGTSARIIEAFGARRKLVSNSLAIKKYEFYDENNIFIYDKNTLGELKNFLKEPFVENSNFNLYYKKFHISNFIKIILENKKENYFRKTEDVM